jgi:hypothetical protein
MGKLSSRLASVIPAAFETPAGVTHRLLSESHLTGLCMLDRDRRAFADSRILEEVESSWLGDVPLDRPAPRRVGLAPGLVDYPSHNIAIEPPVE